MVREEHHRKKWTGALVLGIILLIGAVGMMAENPSAGIALLIFGAGFVALWWWRRGVKCPHCKEWIDKRATRCPHCHADLPARA